MDASNLANMMNIAATAMTAESIRMNTTATNLANSGNVGTTEQTTFHAQHPVFATIVQQLSNNDPSMPDGGVQVVRVEPSKQPLDWHLDPNNPLADEQGRVYLTDVNPVEEMTDMIDASRHYQALAEVIKTGKALALQTIREINS